MKTVNLETATYTTAVCTGLVKCLDASYRSVDAKNPTTPGDLVQIYCTGLGAVTNQPATGAAAPNDPLATTVTLPRVTIGNAPAKVQFSGLASVM